jgi:hypothetical protein
MRTTLNLDDDVLDAVRAIAETEGESLGAIVSRLVRRGLRPIQPKTAPGTLPRFDVADDAPPITPALVRRALEE